MTLFEGFLAVYSVFFLIIMVSAFHSDRAHQREFKAKWGMPEANQAWDLLRRLRQFQPGEKALAEWGITSGLTKQCDFTIRCNGDEWEVGYHLFDGLLICNASHRKLLDALKAVEQIVETEGQGRLISAP